MQHAKPNGAVHQNKPVSDFALPNARRIVTARHAILAASWARGDNPAVCDEAVIDLLADLRHFCAARRIDFERCARLAAIHFESEMGGAS